MSLVAQTAKAQAGTFGDRLALLGSSRTPQGEAKEFDGQRKRTKLICMSNVGNRVID